MPESYGPDEIIKLRSDNERLRAMLKPFADMADRVRSGEGLPDAGVIVDCCYYAKAALER